jgi:hypothetical protein
MSRGSTTIGYRLPNPWIGALITKAMRLGLSPGELARKMLIDNLMSDGLTAETGASAGANAAPFPTPESAPRPPTLVEQFGGRLHEATPRWPYPPRRLEPRSAPAVRDRISAGIANQETLTQADGATANRPARDQRSAPASGMLSDAAIGMPPSLRKR